MSSRKIAGTTRLFAVAGFALIAAQQATADLMISDLRILAHGDSITYGTLGDGQDANGTAGDADATNAQLATRGSYRRFLDLNLAEQGSGYMFVGGRDDRDSFIANGADANQSLNYNSVRGGSIENPWWNGSVSPQLSDPNGSMYYRNYGIGGISGDLSDTFASPNRNINRGVNDATTNLAGDFADRSLVDRIVDNNHTSGGITAANLRDPNNPNMVDGDFRQFVFGGTTPNVILTHIGTNSMNSSPGTADDQLGRLLETYQLLKTTDTWDMTDAAGTKYLSADTQVLVAKILPRITDGGVLSNTALDNTFNYNQQIADLNNTSIYGNLSTDFKNHLTVVDMFTILVDDVVLGVKQAFETDGDAGNDFTEAELRAILQKDSDDYVDWVLGIDEGATNLTDLGDTTGANMDLLGDSLHPNEVGYAVMAEVWTQGLLSAGLIPEPGTIALLAVGCGFVMTGRRRKRAA